MFVTGGTGKLAVQTAHGNVEEHEYAMEANSGLSSPHATEPALALLK